MTTRLSIGDFSRMTHLSVKALRHYHDVGVLEPADIDPATGYRHYDTSQVTTAQVVRRLRDLGMPLDQVRAVLAAPDVAARNAEIGAHLARMERQLEQTQAAVAALRALLTGPSRAPAVELRAIPAVTALMARATVGAADLGSWAERAFAGIAAALAAPGVTAAGPPGALFPGDFFELERAEITVFQPLARPAIPAAAAPEWGRPAPGADRSSAQLAADARSRQAAAAAAARLPAGIAVREIPAVEVAVLVHEGPAEGIDRTYGALGTAVAQRAIGVAGPIREYFLVGPWDTDDESRHRTEVCWPVFRTAGQ
ncbi:MAG TPA: MerR family transcriptional regulator [Streptosporangiaceae bacterium]|nr:MerR family transcriptional regulator [Streptosporangiaceae bacterium]